MSLAVNAASTGTANSGLSTLDDCSFGAADTGFDVEAILFTVGELALAILFIIDVVLSAGRTVLIGAAFNPVGKGLVGGASMGAVSKLLEKLLAGVASNPLKDVETVG